MTAMLCALAAFLGHVWPVCFHFKGGKGVAVAFGALLGVNWQLALAALAVVAVVVALTRMVSLGSVLAAVSFPVLAYFMEPDFLFVGCIMAALLIYAHRGNIKRLLKGEENKLSFGKKTEKVNADDSPAACFENSRDSLQRSEAIRRKKELR